jgi:SAM-dependent methyltransferase
MEELRRGLLMQQAFSDDLIFLMFVSDFVLDKASPFNGSVTTIFGSDIGGVYCFSFEFERDKNFFIENLLQKRFIKLFENTWVPSGFDASANSELVLHYFDYIANQYDSIIDTSWNIACYDFLYNEAMSERRRPNSVLDFGSGTGLIVETNFYETLRSVRGFDQCTAMRALSRRRGLNTVCSLESIKARSLDLIISCFVFHYGLSDAVFDSLVLFLDFGGVLVANVHKDIGLNSYIKRCELLVGKGFRYEVKYSVYGSVLLLERLSV